MTQWRKKCKECRKSFPSKKSLFGHMRCHPERTYRGMNPAPSISSSTSSGSDVTAEKLRATLEWKLTGRRGRTSCKVSPCKQALLYGDTNSKHDDQDVQKPSPNTLMTKKRIKVSDLEEEVGSKKQKSTCNICGESFNSYQALGGHMTGRHKKEIKFKDKVNRKKENCGSIKIHACKICGTTFPSGQALGGHQRLHYNASFVADQKAAGKKEELKSGAGQRVLDLDLNEKPATDEQGHDQQGVDLSLRLSLP